VKNLYDILGLPPNASTEDICLAYRREVIEGLAAGAADIETVVSEMERARRVLSDADPNPLEALDARRAIERITSAASSDSADADASRVALAYSILSNPTERARYDATRRPMIPTRPLITHSPQTWRQTTQCQAESKSPPPLKQAEPPGASKKHGLDLESLMIKLALLMVPLIASGFKLTGVQYPFQSAQFQFGSTLGPSITALVLGLVLGFTLWGLHAAVSDTSSRAHGRLAILIGIYAASVLIWLIGVAGLADAKGVSFVRALFDLVGNYWLVLLHLAPFYFACPGVEVYAPTET
jgi:curved DNA-binding protein CbpA